MSDSEQTIDVQPEQAEADRSKIGQPSESPGAPALGEREPVDGGGDGLAAGAQDPPRPAAEEELPAAEEELPAAEEELPATEEKLAATEEELAATEEELAGADEELAATEEDSAEVEGDLDELVKTASQRDEYLALAQRTQADFENYRKRVARDSAAAHGRGIAALAKELLPALDNLDRALEDAGSHAPGGSAANGPDGNDPLLEGVRLVRSELRAALARVGIESFSPMGEPFDPALHEAVATAPQASEDLKSGTVVEVYESGYRLGESIIRPARVVVAS
ncbi:MAG: nucleotide exchange factor GrpE [Solirubrobacteraceae bacterium]|jgi:molecular chaperone GrpE